MKTFSIKELINATNSIFNSKNDKREKIKSKKKIKPKFNKIDHSLISEIVSTEENNIKSDSINNQTVIEAKVKDHMINELYLFMKKKIKKNTLKLIIDEQIEIKKLKKEISLLKQNKDNLNKDYNDLKNEYELIFENYEKLKINEEKLTLQYNELKSNNELLNNNLNDVDLQYRELSVFNKKLLNDNDQLQNNLSLINHEKENLINENIELKDSLKEKDDNLQITNQKNRSFEINNAELKNTISRYIVNSKTLQEQLNLTKKSNNNELEEINRKVKFYQDENVRLSGELMLFQKQNENIKINLADIETEKQKISHKIKELSKSIDQKTNVVETTFVNENYKLPDDDVEKLNDKEQKSLDEVINRIFNKI